MKSKRILSVLAATLCVFMLGGWTSPPEVRYGDPELVSLLAATNIYYTEKVIAEDLTTTNGVPEYRPVGDMTNACGAAAGTTAIGFYDKYYANLIPGWDSFYSNGKYKSQNATYVNPIMQNLYVAMRTNVDGPGVTEAEFKSGLSSYVTGKGYSLQYNSITPGGNFNYTAFKAAVNSNKITALFVKPGNVYNITPSNGYDVVSSVAVTESHIMIAYGYTQINYYNGNTVRTDTYVKVATGKSGINMAYYKIDNSLLDAAYILQIN